LSGYNWGIGAIIQSPAVGVLQDRQTSLFIQGLAMGDDPAFPNSYIQSTGLLEYGSDVVPANTPMGTSAGIQQLPE